MKGRRRDLLENHGGWLKNSTGKRGTIRIDAGVDQFGGKQGSRAVWEAYQNGGKENAKDLCAQQL